MIDESSLIIALKDLEEKHHNKLGYDVKEILGMLKMNCDMEKHTRGKLRSLISKQKYPEFLTAGDKDIVYCPGGKGSGRYRLSEYR